MSITYFAKTNHPTKRQRFGIKLEDRFRHMYVIGRTGTGKTSLLETLAIQDIHQGHGLCFLDPHGDSTKKLLASIPPERAKDVIYFDPANPDWSVGINLFNPQANITENSALIEEFIGIMKRLWSGSSGEEDRANRMEHYLRNIMVSLLEQPNVTLLHILTVLNNDDYRDRIIKETHDPIAKAFWLYEYLPKKEAYLDEIISPIRNRLGRILTAVPLRHTVAQSKTFSVDKVLNEQKIFIADLSKGKLGEDNSSFLGMMIMTLIQLAALKRSRIEENERKPFFLYGDEFQNFITPVTKTILSEARKFKLGMVIAHQYLDQMPEYLQNAIMGNVGTTICFTLGSKDANAMARHFYPRFKAEDFINLGKYEVILSLMIEGVGSDPFTAKTLPPVSLNYQQEQVIFNDSQDNYARSHKRVANFVERTLKGRL